MTESRNDMTTTTPATEYTVSVSCNFDADSPEDAVRQMTAWLDDAAYHAGYRVAGTDGSSSFVDADRL